MVAFVSMWDETDHSMPRRTVGPSGPCEDLTSRAWAGGVVSLDSRRVSEALAARVARTGVVWDQRGALFPFRVRSLHLTRLGFYYLMGFETPPWSWWEIVEPAEDWWAADLPYVDCLLQAAVLTQQWHTARVAAGAEVVANRDIMDRFTMHCADILTAGGLEVADIDRLIADLLDGANDFHECGMCGTIQPAGTPVWSDGNQEWCLDCCRYEPDMCSSCESFLHEYDVVWRDGERYCEGCAPEQFYCSECDNEYNDADSAAQCCNVRSGQVNSYSYKPRPVFYGQVSKPIVKAQPHALYLGLELEVECNTRRGIEPDEVADLAASYMGERVYVKEDGSLSHGCEIVSMPMMLHEHRRSGWDELLPVLAQNGVRSWDAPTCGLHIHMSRNAFEGEAHAYKWLQFIYGNKQSLTKLVGRNSTQWASFDECSRERIRLDSKPADQAGYAARYRAVNVQNRDTYECRFFRPSLQPKTVYAALELCSASHLYARTQLTTPQAVKGEVQFDRFRTWVEDSTDYPNLVARMGARLGTPDDLDDCGF